MGAISDVVMEEAARGSGLGVGGVFRMIVAHGWISENSAVTGMKGRTGDGGARRRLPR
jgi:hypothetical protein